MFVTRLGLWVICLFALPLAAADLDLQRTLRGVEERYNSIKTLEVQFEQAYTAPNSVRRTEAGKLQLRKPGRMRWDYTKPAGKVFVGDGKLFWFYSPADNRVEKMNAKDADDLRAPLAFLIGKLDFARDFAKYIIKPDGAVTWITCEPKNPDKSPYREVSFIVGPDFHIDRLIVKGQDASTMEFRFVSEKRNPPQPESIYQFTPPKGAEIVEGSK
jgi:outer membrane lipoprotein carrier protein